jgi:serine/threonine protein kinase
LLKKIKHSNVIRLLEVFESTRHLLIVMEYAGGGDLLRLVKRKGRLEESDAKFIFKQIAYGLAHIHCRSVIHRDIKLDNILLDCGTPAYLAPEIINDKGYEGFFVDVWSLGVLLYAMLCGTVPFKAPNLDELHKLILKGVWAFNIELSKDA